MDNVFRQCFSWLCQLSNATMDVLISSILLAILAPNFEPFGGAKDINTQSPIFYTYFFNEFKYFLYYLNIKKCKT